MDAEQYIEEKLINIYDKDGPSGVLDWVKENKPRWPWEYCIPCEMDTPTFDDICAVCFTAREWSRE